MNVAGHNELLSRTGMQLVVRQAQPEDAMDILHWRNDPLACAMSRHPQPIAEAAHMAWYSQAVADPSQLLLIGIRDRQKIGIVRFDRRQASMWEVSITLALDARGQGLGRALLEIALEYLRNVCASTPVLAVIRLNNEPSLRLFNSLRFRRVSDDGEFVSLVLSSSVNPPCL